MKKQRLTEEEVNEFKPSYENQLCVECDGGKYIDGFEKIRIISPVKNGSLAIINGLGNLAIVSYNILGHYPSQKQPKEIVLYEHISEYSGRVTFLNKDGVNINFSEGFPHHAQVSGWKKIKNGRKLRLDLNTGEVEKITNE